MDDEPMKKLIITIPFNNNAQALLASQVLNVDKEFKGSGIQRNIIADNSNLLVTFEGADYKKLRVSINGLLKNVLLIVKTIKLFPN